MPYVGLAAALDLDLDLAGAEQTCRHVGDIGDLVSRRRSLSAGGRRPDRLAFDEVLASLRSQDDLRKRDVTVRRKRDLEGRILA